MLAAVPCYALPVGKWAADSSTEISNETDKTNLDPQFVMAYQKCVIHVENDIIYTLNVSYGDEEKNEAEEIVRKWMNSF